MLKAMKEKKEVEAVSIGVDALGDQQSSAWGMSFRPVRSELRDQCTIQYQPIADRQLQSYTLDIIDRLRSCVQRPEVVKPESDEDRAPA